MDQKKAAFLTLGCKVNSYETNAMEKLFEEAGYKIVPFSEKANVYIINTCTVTNIADRKSRQMLHRARKKNPEAIIVAAGCYVQAAKEELEQDLSIDVIVGNNEKSRIVKLVETFEKNNQIVKAVSEDNQKWEYEEMQIASTGDKTRAYIKIQDGCNQYCSYCIIPYARGRVRSRSDEEAVAEVKKLVEQGYKEIVLTGIHLSSYGVDEENKDFVKLQGKPLLHLIEKLNTLDGLYRIRLGSLEPRIISEEFAKKLASFEKICPHFHLSLQSGCNSTLKRMNRRYTTQEYYDKCEILRKYFVNPAITTDVIVGFPGETEEEFLETGKFLEQVSFAQMHIFKYSVRKGTAAERMEKQIPDNIKHKRSEDLLVLEKNLEEKYQKNFINQKEEILLEEKISIDGESYYIGYTKRYLKCAVPADEYLKSNDLVSVLIEKKLSKNILLCKII